MAAAAAERTAAVEAAEARAAAVGEAAKLSEAANSQALYLLGSQRRVIPRYP